METILDATSSSTSLDAVAREHLRTAAWWGRFLAIVGFIGLGLMVIMGLFAGTLLTAAGDIPGSEGMGSGLTGLVTVLYVGIALLYFFPTLYLYRFATAAMDTADGGSSEQLTTALHNLSRMFRFVGILVMIMLCFYGLGLLIGVGGLFAAL